MRWLNAHNRSFLTARHDCIIVRHSLALSLTEERLLSRFGGGGPRKPFTSSRYGAKLTYSYPQKASPRYVKTTREVYSL
jgi:hypothetical protein